MSLHDDIDEERKAAMPDAAMVARFRKYAKGDQRGTLTAAQQRILRSVLGNKFADNVCKMVLQQLSNRLLLARFDVPNRSVEMYLRDVWTLNHLPRLSYAVHYALFRDRAVAVGLDWTGERVQLVRELWWDGKQGTFVFLDSTGQPRMAVKEWSDKKQTYRVVYHPDRIERYRKNSNGWESFRLPSDPATGDLAWRDRDGSPLGVPFVPFFNTLEPTDDEPSQGDDRYGASVLDGGLLGLQDEINDLHRDITAAARFVGYQMLWATGFSPVKDEQGNDIPLRVEPGAVFTNPDANGRYGTLPAGSLAELERALQIKLQAVSRQTGVPMYLIGGDWPSGDALIQAERALTDRIESAGRAVGPAWASVMHEATKLATVFGGQNLDLDGLITSVFQPAEGRNPLIQTQIAQARADFVSNREVLRILGYSPDDITRIEQERDAQRQQLSPLDSVNLQRAQAALARDAQPATQSIAERLRAVDPQGGVA